MSSRVIDIIKEDAQKGDITIEEKTVSRGISKNRNIGNLTPEEIEGIVVSEIKYIADPSLEQIENR